jgi:hypothetical protein
VTARRQPSFRRGAVLTLIVSVVLVAAAVAAMGRPDLATAADFLTGARPTHDGAIATVEVLVSAQLIVVLRGSAPSRLGAGGRRWRARAVLIAGALVFVGGAVHHQAPAQSLCCGDLARADRLLR